MKNNAGEIYLLRRLYFRSVTPCSLWIFTNVFVSVSYPADGSRAKLQNNNAYLPDYTASYATRMPSIFSYRRVNPKSHVGFSTNKTLQVRSGNQRFDPRTCRIQTMRRAMVTSQWVPSRPGQGRIDVGLARGAGGECWDTLGSIRRDDSGSVATY
jgi:hypothetical protein